jgi:hypothetical protein
VKNCDSSFARFPSGCWLTGVDMSVDWAKSGSPKALQNDLSIKPSSSFIVEALELVCISSILEILNRASV